VSATPVVNYGKQYHLAAQHFLENHSKVASMVSRQNMKTFCPQDIFSTFTTGVNEIGGAS
jgi:hypothetical protein